MSKKFENGVKETDIFEQKPLTLRFDDYVKSLEKKDAGELLDIASDVASNLADAATSPTPFNLIKCGVNIWKTLSDTQMYPEEYFRHDWVSPFNECFNEFIVKVLDDLPCKVIRTSEEDRIIKIALVLGEEVGWILNTQRGEVQGLYVKKSRYEETREVLKKAQWNFVDFRYIVMEKIPGSGDYSESIHFTKDDDIVGLTSSKADEYSQYLKRCMDAGVSRTILFYGPPGTGKSTIARAIADKLDLRTLRIRVEDVGSFDNQVIFEAIDVYRPDAIILDDLDRANKQAHLLETMDRFHKHIKLVFATVNHQDQLDDALLRPGRFDEIVKIRQLDDAVIKKMLGEANMHMFDQLKKWPIAFIQEYITRRRFMSEEEAMKACKELQRRVNKLKSYDESDDEDDEVVEQGDAVASDVADDAPECSDDSTDEDEDWDEEDVKVPSDNAKKAKLPFYVARLLKANKIKFRML